MAFWRLIIEICNTGSFSLPNVAGVQFGTRLTGDLQGNFPPNAFKTLAVVCRSGYSVGVFQLEGRFIPHTSSSTLQ